MIMMQLLNGNGVDTPDWQKQQQQLALRQPGQESVIAGEFNKKSRTLRQAIDEKVDTDLEGLDPLYLTMLDRMNYTTQDDGSLNINAGGSKANINIRKDGGISLSGDFDVTSEEGIRIMLETAVAAKAVYGNDEVVAWSENEQMAMIGTKAASLVGVNRVENYFGENKERLSRTLDSVDPALAQKIERVWEKMKLEAQQAAVNAPSADRTLPAMPGGNTQSFSNNPGGLNGGVPAPAPVVQNQTPPEQKFSAPQM